MKRRGRPPATDLLTPGEWRVAEGVRHGLTNPQLAKRLNVSVNAVKYHVANALQKLGFERRAQLRRWDGVRADSALKKGKHMDIALGQLGQISRAVKNIDASVEWYSKTLGLKHLYTFGKLAFFDCGGVRLFLNEGSGGDSILYFRVEGIHAVCEALRARGVELANAPHLIHKHADGTEEWMAFIKDNEGRPLGLMEQVSAR